MESPQPKAQGDDAETPTQKQARLRRERREAKLKTDGTSRLEKIAKVSGRQNLPDLPPNIGQVSEDPDEVDLSTHPSASRTPNSQDQQRQQQQQSSGINGPPSEADIRAMLRVGAPQPGVDHEGANPEEDPMMKMLSQLMGGMPGGEGQDGGSGADVGGLPPGLAAMLGAGGMAGMGGAPAVQPKSPYAYLWKIVHAVFALCLGVYVTATSTALQANVARNDARQVLEKEAPAREGVNLFFVFATVELVLQTSRFYFENGNTSGQLGGWFGLVAGFLPKPYKDYLFLMGRYARIWGTVVEDAMVIVFVVGCVAWWNGAAGGVGVVT